MIVGIDLGTTHSLVAVWKENQSVLIPNSVKKMLTPSVVSLDDDKNIVVGEAAQNCPYSIANFKRYMGSKKKFTLGGETHTPEELSAFILKSLVRDAEAFLGEEIKRAIISVPAYFNNTQRKATVLAGKLAGLEVEGLINEPTAAALSYGLHQREEETQFLVFDLGGGTFDVSIVELFSGIMEVRSSAGDNYLGGEDFSDVLEEAIRAKLWNEFEIDTTKFDVEKMFELRQMIHALKHQFSKSSEGTFSLQIEDHTVEFLFARDTFEKLTEPLITRMRRPLEKALSDARLRAQELDMVILVGGATRMPFVQAEIAKMLGIFPNSVVHPDESVAIGAGIQAALKERHKDLKDVVVTDVCPFTLGTSVRPKWTKSGSRFLPIIERNTTIPVSRAERLFPTIDNQKRMKIDVFQGESYNPEENILIGELTIPLPPAPAGEESVDVRYSYDVNGLLEVEVTVVSTGKKKSLLIKNQDHNPDDAEIAASLEKLKKFKIHPRDVKENRELLAKLEYLFEFFKGEERDEIAGVLDSFRRALNTQDPDAIGAAKQTIESFLAGCEFFEI